jgi:serine/threonine protein kinase
MTLFRSILNRIRSGKNKSAAEPPTKTKLRTTPLESDAARTQPKDGSTDFPVQTTYDDLLSPQDGISLKWKRGDRILDRYEIHDIKKGGMGAVYLCFDHRYKMPVAIKTLLTLSNTGLSHEDLLDKFYLEAESWVRLEKHKNIVQAIGVERIEGQPYILLEFITEDENRGADLSGWLQNEGRLSFQDSLNFAIQFCTGMEHAEKVFKSMGKPFVHRDIKPGNIMVSHDKIIKITDFGLVKTFDHSKEDIFVGAGTPPYMSPEQFEGKKDIDIRSDIYAFGCVLYEMLTGNPPFVCKTMENYFYNHLKVIPDPVVNRIPEVPEKLNHLIMKCLEKEPERRYKDFSVLKNELLDMYYVLTGIKIQENIDVELESWERINKGIALVKLGYRKDAVLDYNYAMEIDKNAVGTLLPPDLSKIREWSCPKKRENKLIFNIMSVYSNYSNQKCIADILDILVSQYGVKLISVEGGTGKIDLEFYRNLPDDENKKQVADYFLQEARIQGHEYFAITTNQDIVFYGADDEKLYDINLRAFTKGSPDKEKWISCCNDIEQAFHILKDYIYNNELKMFDEKKDSLKKPSAQYLTFLTSFLKTFSASDSYPNIENMVAANTLEMEINSVKANQEKDDLLTYLKNNLEDKAGLLKAIYDFQNKDITEFQFYSTIKEITDKQLSKDIWKKYPDLELYIRRVICIGTVDPLEFYYEMDSAEAEIREKFYTSDDQKTLDLFKKHIGLLKRAYATKLTPIEDQYLKTNRDQISGRNIVDFISEQARKYDIPMTQMKDERENAPYGKKVIFIPTEASEIEKSLEHHNGFYSAAEQRSRALIKNCLKFMELEGEAIGVLVTGGFHTSSIASYLKEERIPYIALVPVYELSDSDDTRYQDALAGKKTPLEEALDKKR